MILVTGAAGKTGTAVVRQLAARDETVRAMVRRPQQLDTAKNSGAAQVSVADFRDPDGVALAMQGIRAVYHIPPNMMPDEAELGQTVISAARAAGIEHFVFHSVLHPQTEGMPHHWQKMRVEETLFQSGLQYTILQPTAYMQNLMAYWADMVERGVYALPYSSQTQISLVDLEDVAAAAAIVLTQPGHLAATYELAGSAAVTQTEVANLVGQHLGHPVRAEAIPISEWEERARAAGLGNYQVETLIKMFDYYQYYGFRANSNVLGWLLGRRPTTLREYIERQPI